MEEDNAKNASWQLPDKMWEQMKPLIPSRKSPEGRPRVPNLRRLVEGIFYVLRTGIQWKAIPKEFGASSTVYDYFRLFIRAEVFEKLWTLALEVYDDLIGLEWTWQSIDGAMTKAPLGGEATGPNPTDRGKRGTKRSVLTEGKGIPMAIVVGGANRHDMKLLAKTLDAVVVERPEPTPDNPQHLNADKGYDFAKCHEEAKNRGYIPHIPSRGQREEIPNRRRWVVEVCHSWLNRFRKILVRFEKKLCTHLALLQFACAYIVFKRARVFG